MEYLVTMTTHVPDGTTDAAVDEMRSREAAHSRQLATEGHLLRLWRPPLQPGEWRSLGLFAAVDRTELEDVLISMPLRVWRTDEVLPLSCHPNDPGQKSPSGPSKGTSGGSEFLTTFTEVIPPGTPEGCVDAANVGEADRARELGEHGQLLRLWVLPGDGRALGLWVAHDGEEMRSLLASLPLSPWLNVETVQLSAHPSDPALGRS
jgi:muconolactone delta-isomerase